MSEQTMTADVAAAFAQARADLWKAIARGVDLGLNPPTGVRDHETAGYFHALLELDRCEDVWPWACHFGVPVSTDYRHEPLAEPEVHDYPGGRRQHRACVLLGADRSVDLGYSEDIPDVTP